MWTRYCRLCIVCIAYCGFVAFQCTEAVYHSSNYYQNSYQNKYYNPNRGPNVVGGRDEFPDSDAYEIREPNNYEKEGSQLSRQHYSYQNQYQAQSPSQSQYQQPPHQSSYPPQFQQKRQQQQHQSNSKESYKLYGHQMRANTSASINDNHKCRIWIPAEALEKYPRASVIQYDQLKMINLIEICCEGYGPIRWRGITKCVPLCENCENGSCVAPGKCECYEGYTRTDNGDCVFTCPLGCLNGRCYLDGSCQCDRGYKLDETRKFCRPICSGGCGLKPGHNCTEPEVCGCAKGYKLTDTGCAPICQPECGKGECVDANECKCDPGFTLKDNVCQSDCYQKCDNGYCYSRNRCICKPGFTYNERTSQCIPKS